MSMSVITGSITVEDKIINEHVSICESILPVIVFPPLYGRELMAWSRSPLLV